MKYLIVVCFILLISVNIFSQKKTDDIWNALSELKFVNEYDSILGLNIDSPVFSKRIKKMEKSKIELEGFIIYENEDGSLILSRLPNSQIAIICGKPNINPSRIVQLAHKKSTESYLNKKVKVKGDLYLNYWNVNNFPYKLENTEIVKL
jgi:hypothetical protein